jgi:ornithine cyclodeaminase/alanine dehydrogenase-like protein (mu-crystallin family)
MLGCMALLLTERDVRALLPMTDLIDAMDRALAMFSTGQVRQPVRSVVELGAHGFFGVMPAALESPAAAGVKLVTVVPGNHDRHLPSHLATILLLNHETGALEAVLDGRYITEARTAAVSAVSARHLSRGRGVRTAGIIGSGVQARSHAEALSHVLDLEALHIWSPTAAHRDAAVEEIAAATGLDVRAAPSAFAAVDRAGVVVLVTSATSPVIEADWIAPGTHVIGVGACRPNQREMPSALIGRARLVVDSREAAVKEAGDILLARQDGVAAPIAAELGEICAGTAPGRQTSGEVTIFKSLGLAVEDIVAADLVVRRARAEGVGAQITV